MCYNKLMVRKGDTLIEVTLAVGIFSMVAVAIVSVMNSSTSGAQTALESTLTREEIDAQAEALRFIQSSYVADKGTEDQRFVNLWKKITQNAIDISGYTDESKASLLQYSPDTCLGLYDPTNGEVPNRHAFIIDYRNLGTFSDVNQVFFSANLESDKDKFGETMTYPRLVYKSKSGTSEDQTSLVADLSAYSLYRAEGIYIIAVRDDSTTVINGDNKSAFYDFYIRTCWYGSNANEPSTISTVVRLYDPDIIEQDGE